MHISCQQSAFADSWSRSRLYHSRYDAKYRRVLAAVEERHFRANVQHLILSIAGMLRIVEERARKALPHRPDLSCGLLFEPLGSSERALVFRESCNKIIHAQKIEFITADGVLAVGRRQVGGIKYYKPQILLYGERGNQQWKAQLDIIEFCRASLEMAEIS